jgi:hypothetical protein
LIALELIGDPSDQQARWLLDSETEDLNLGEFVLRPSSVGPPAADDELHFPAWCATAVFVGKSANVFWVQLTAPFASRPSAALLGAEPIPRAGRPATSGTLSASR